MKLKATMLWTLSLPVLYLFSGCISPDGLKDQAVAKPKTFYLASCYVLDENFNTIKQLSSHWICEPKPDGGWFASDNSYLISYDPQGNILWKKSGVYHHQIRIWDENAIVVLKSELKKTKLGNLKYDSVQLLNFQDGKLLKEFSIYNEINLKPKGEPSFLDIAPFPTKEKFPHFKGEAFLEKTHLNSISIYDGKIVINEHSYYSFVLDKNLKLLGPIKFSDLAIYSKKYLIHDLQLIGENHYLYFRAVSFKYFRIFEVKNGKIIFEFPKEDKDLELVYCCGGVDKTKQGYVVGFPGPGIGDNFSIVGLVSFEGRWIQRKILPYRIQDIRRIKYDDFLIQNKVR
jgi:hypothetical protein